MHFYFVIMAGMIQKVLKVGSSAAVTIPKKSLKELGSAKRTAKNDKITLWTLEFIERYRSDLEALAKT